MRQQENIISAQIDGGLHEKQALLDEFAKAAMQGMVSNGTFGTYDNDEISAHRCYEIATAMMQERERRLEG